MACCVALVMAVPQPAAAVAWNAKMSPKVSAKPRVIESAWDHAVALRQALESQPLDRQTPAAYEAVLNAFRSIYHRDPATGKAPASVAAVADLLAERGRVFHDRAWMRSAIGQYEFLRGQYAHSPSAANALLLEAEICREDLKDMACARRKLAQAMAESPGTSYAEQAQFELKQLDRAKTETVSRTQLPKVPAAMPPAPQQTPENQASPAKPHSARRPTEEAALASESSAPETAHPEPIESIPAHPIPPAAPASDGERSLVRALGLKVGRIVIDAGHGGHDSGTLGPGGIEEKDVVLDVALRVGRLLRRRLGAQIVYTRSDDTFVPLQERTAIANRAQADLFLSIHANSSPDSSARGVETYYLNFIADPSALEVAGRENAVGDASVHQLSDLVRKIALKDKIDESREFAADVEQGLYSGLKAGNEGLKDRGVKKAPFVVLIGAQMPSVLTEISFLTNPEDARQLRSPRYRQRIAESLDAGVERYLRGLSSVPRAEALAASSGR